MTTRSPRTSSRPRWPRPGSIGPGSARTTRSRTSGGSWSRHTPPGGGAAGTARSRPRNCPTRRPRAARTGSTCGTRSAVSPAGSAVVVLRFYEDLTEAETARLMGSSVGTVKSQTAKALAKLRLDPAIATPADLETPR
ncbi:sigma factor-like helix-turn-helix DNA-binding protein [Kribbella sp. NPDC051936]|uniref:sigma factor-like helix-turn-helix DNA-binding protein n=1 Tax=Kribbella sp. NPDC051936 TaxID=3154946 RepID=UPI003433D66F